MMKIDILTLFPEMFEGFKTQSIIKRAIENKKVQINTINFRDYSKDKHKKVDDTPYGGGNGMVLMCQPIFDAVNDIKTKKSKVILLSPSGEKFNQKKAIELSKEKHLIFICGHYEGFDERIKTIVDEEISIGDYVLTGGEIPSMVISDCVVRLIPDVIKKESYEKESFYDNMLDYPSYTKPRNYNGLAVPDVLLSGDHKKILKWREEKKVELTNKKRPDLLNKKYKIIKNKTDDKIFLDDIINIKVTIVSDENDIRKYVLQKSDLKKLKISNFNCFTGYKLKSKNSKSKLVIYNNDFIKKVIIKNIYKKIDFLKYRFIICQNDSDDEASTKVLGEAQMLKQFIISMYANYLGKSDLTKILKKIDILVKEFIKTKTLNQSFAIETKEKGKGIR